MLERNAGCALPATAANAKTIRCDISAKSGRLFSVRPFEFRRDPFLEYKICAHHHFVGDVMARLVFAIIVVAVLSVPFVAASYNESSAQTGALRHAARLPKAIRGLHGNGLLDGHAGAKVRIREAVRRRRPPTEAPLRASACFPRGLLS